MTSKRSGINTSSDHSHIHHSQKVIRICFVTSVSTGLVCTTALWRPFKLQK